MQRTPILVLICGILAAAMGAVLVLVDYCYRIERLVWLAIPITALGLVLVGLWTRSALSRPDRENPVGVLATPLPGRWYPYAVVGVGIVLSCWLLYWTKLR